MKPILMILGLVLAVGAGAVGGMMAAPRATQAPVDAFADVRPAATSAPAANPELEKRLQSMSLELSGLQTEIAALREERSRAPAAAAAEMNKSPEQLAHGAQTAAGVAAINREAILMVLADERAAQEKKREDERKERELKADEAKADRVTQKLGLSAAQRSTLVDYYAAERAHFTEMRSQFRDGASEADTARDAFRQGREWRTNELTRLFGTDLGAQINESEGDGVRARVVGGGGQRRGGGEGQNGEMIIRGAGPTAPGGNR